MDKKIRELAAWAIKTAKSAGANDCRVQIESEREVQVTYRDRKPENIKEASTRGLYIQIFANGRYSSQNTSDLRKNALETFIKKAVASTRLLAEDPYRTLPDPKYYKGRKDMDLGLVDPAYKKMTPEDRHTIAKGVEEGVFKEGGDKIITATATCQDYMGDSFTMTSNGFDGYEDYTYFVAGVRVTAQGEGDRRPAGYNYIGSINKGLMPSPEEIGRVGAKRTLALIGGKKIKTEKLPIIIENRNVARILGGFVGGLYGRNIQQKQSFLADQKGEKVGSNVFTIVNDPFIKNSSGSRLFDSDGFAAKKRTMINKGVLDDFFLDWYYSRKLGWEPTTGRPANVVIPQGNRSVEEIIKDLGRCIHVTGFIGGNSNSTTGDMSVGIQGTLYDGGEPVHPVTEMNMADNHLELWKKLVEAANDTWIYSSWRMPSLVFEDIVVSGI